MILMDAKFNHFTKRPCTASAMLVPLRTGNAPLENTEEEYNTIRLLSMTDAEATARQPDKKTQVRNRNPANRPIYP